VGEAHRFAFQVFVDQRDACQRGVYAQEDEFRQITVEMIGDNLYLVEVGAVDEAVMLECLGRVPARFHGVFPFCCRGDVIDH